MNALSYEIIRVGKPSCNWADVCYSTKDAHLISLHEWALSDGYANSLGANGFVSMHRLVAGLPDTKRFAVHHINEDTRDNRASNLMILTPNEHSIFHGRVSCNYSNRDYTIMIDPIDGSGRREVLLSDIRASRLHLPAIWVNSDKVVPP